MSRYRPPSRRARRPAVRSAALVATVLALGVGGTAACGPFTGSERAAPVAAEASAAPTHHAVEDNTFPTTITHRYGDTELEAPPERIVTLGVHDADTLVSLGLRPVGVREWAGAQGSYADLPWAPDDLAPGEPAVASPEGEIDYAAVAALQPDLITVINSRVTESEYRRLSEIAPTIAQVPDTDDMLSSWQEETRLMGKAVGRPAQADRVVEDLMAALAAVRDRYPVLTDADVALVTYDSDRTLRLVNPYDPRARLLAALGMRFPDSIADAASDDAFDVETDLDKLADLEKGLDLVVWLGDPGDDPTALEGAAELMRADQDYTDIDPVRHGASVFLTDPAAIWFGSGPSLAYAAEANGAALAKALGGKAEEDAEGVTPGPLPGQDPAADRERAARAAAVPTPEPTPTPSPLPAPSGTAEPPTTAPAPEETASPGPSGIVPVLSPGGEPPQQPAARPVHKRRPKHERDQRKPR